ncbi:MAG: thioredoxin-disulfide reductase [Acidobacteriia bacterium]|nr:thioredoxin-disulfide reductase [Terriglobia bacterium]
MDVRKVFIMGSGPAGLTAAVYAARGNLNPLVVEGHEAGGQLMLTTMVENFPGFRDGIMGPQLMDDMREQAKRFGAEIIQGAVTKVDLSRRPFAIHMDEDRVIQTETLIIATGASARLLGLESERQLMGHGVSTCATCDGFFYRGKEVVVVGGGDSALEEGMFLTKYATRVTLIHRRDSLRASKVMQDRAFKNEKIKFIWNSTVSEVQDVKDGEVKAVKLKNLKTGEESVLNCHGLFVAIGHDPNTTLFKGQLEMDPAGYIVTRDGGTRTSVEGVFAAGDVQDHVYRQAITAAGSGCMAAIDAEHFLSAHGGS